ncbi:RNA methyltransferase [Halobacteriovorax sp. HLS]|uniref:TrmH family RNA methyltransferase n=1 Tax=Halobacteriovorax sp. HLS TaxID=2234000 RepID=UPI000FD80E53|nr:RNA methyltransferase [Halobacteriovorax sp. HLS]
MRDLDLIVGIHSIAEAILCRPDSVRKIIATDEGLRDFKKKTRLNKELKDHDIKIVSSHELQKTAETFYKEIELSYQRVPSQIFMVVDPVETYDLAWLYEELEINKSYKILCLDQVTDVHNAAAIMRTAAFYGVDCVLTGAKGHFGTGPSFARIASGAIEHVKIVICSSLPKAITKLKENGVTVIGFSEHASEDGDGLVKTEKMALVLGAEDVGMSNAVERVVEHKVAIKPLGKIKSLNVSVAGAIAMERWLK